MNATPNVGRSRRIVYILLLAVIVAALALVFRFTPGLATASALPFLAIVLLCPIAMFFMMRNMNGPPR